MDDYINRKAVRDALYEADAILMRGVKILNQFPASDVVPVRHGKWIDSKEDANYKYCMQSRKKIVRFMVEILPKLRYKNGFGCAD